MHTIWSRVSNGSAMLSSFMMALLAAISLSTLLLNTQPNGQLLIGSLKIQKVKMARFPIKKRELAIVNFNVTADITSLFHWNTKQVFLYLGAEYTNAHGVKNEVVIWDRIVRRKQDAAIKVSGKNKYHLKDIANTFKESTPANFTLKYNIMPYVGTLTYGEVTRALEEVDLPVRDMYSL